MRGVFSTQSEEYVLISELTQFYLPMQNSTSSSQATIFGHIWDRESVLFIEVSSFRAVLIRHTYSVNGFEDVTDYMCKVNYVLC